MNMDELKDAITSEFVKRFPNGYANAYISKGLGNPSIVIKLGLLDDASLPYGIRNNDPLNTLHMIRETLGGFEINNLNSGLSVNPKEKYLAMSHIKTAIRQAKNLDADNVVKRYKAYFDKLVTIVNENQHDIYGRDRFDDKFFITN